MSLGGNSNSNGLLFGCVSIVCFGVVSHGGRICCSRESVRAFMKNCRTQAIIDLLRCNFKPCFMAGFWLLYWFVAVVL